MPTQNPTADGSGDLLAGRLVRAAIHRETINLMRRSSPPPRAPLPSRPPPPH